jgi:hypothetical protein
MHDHHARHADNAGDRSNIANKIETELVVQRRVDRVVAPGPALVCERTRLSLNHTPEQPRQKPAPREGHGRED